MWQKKIFIFVKWLSRAENLLRVWQVHRRDVFINRRSVNVILHLSEERASPFPVTGDLCFPQGTCRSLSRQLFWRIVITCQSPFSFPGSFWCELGFPFEFPCLTPNLLCRTCSQPEKGLQITVPVELTPGCWHFQDIRALVSLGMASP